MTTPTSTPLAAPRTHLSVPDSTWDALTQTALTHDLTAGTPAYFFMALPAHLIDLDHIATDLPWLHDERIMKRGVISHVYGFQFDGFCVEFPDQYFHDFLTARRLHDLARWTLTHGSTGWRCGDLFDNDASMCSLKKGGCGRGRLARRSPNHMQAIGVFRNAKYYWANAQTLKEHTP